jgi:hypothetical protein
MKAVKDCAAGAARRELTLRCVKTLRFRERRGEGRRVHRNSHQRSRSGSSARFLSHQIVRAPRRWIRGALATTGKHGAARARIRALSVGLWMLAVGDLWQTATADLSNMTVTLAIGALRRRSDRASPWRRLESVASFRSSTGKDNSASDLDVSTAFD